MEPSLYFEAKHLEHQRVSVAGGTAIVYSVRSPDKVTPNEDAAAILPVGADAAVLAVADGMGGLPAGELAARVTMERLAACIQEADANPARLETAILKGIEDAQHAVVALGMDAATTLVVVEIHGRRIRPYHVGDSMSLLVGQRGRIKLQTASHSPVGYAILAGLLDAVDAMHHEDRHLVSNAIGMSDMRVEIGMPVTIAPRDTLLLASDGLFDNLHLSEIVDRMRQGPLSQAAMRLAEDCAARMENPGPNEPSKADDLTFIAYRPSLGPRSG